MICLKEIAEVHVCSYKVEIDYTEMIFTRVGTVDEVDHSIVLVWLTFGAVYAICCCVILLFLDFCYLCTWLFPGAADGKSLI